MEGALEQGNLKLGLDSGWPPQALTGLLMTAHGTWSPKGAIFSSFFLALKAFFKLGLESGWMPGGSRRLCYASLHLAVLAFGQLSAEEHSSFKMQFARTVFWTEVGLRAKVKSSLNGNAPFFVVTPHRGSQAINLIPGHGGWLMAGTGQPNKGGEITIEG